MDRNFGFYGVEDFTKNESFQRWAKGVAPVEEQSRWDDFYRNHPDQQEAINLAKLAVLSFSRGEQRISAARVENSWSLVDRRVNRSARRVQMYRWVGYAAMLVLLASVVFYFLQNQQTSFHIYQTAFGEKQNIFLPDGTSIALNANSRVKVPAQWSDQQREAWVEQGEAFFNVTKTTDHQPFIVYTDDLKVKVLGTEFDIKKRSGEIRVVLREGKVAVSFMENEKILKPGEMALANTGSSEILVEPVEVKYYDSWLKSRLVFDNTTLTEVAEMIEEYYGVSVEVASEVEDRKLSGELPNENLDLLLNAVEITLGVDIIQKDERVSIKPKR